MSSSSATARPGRRSLFIPAAVWLCGGMLLLLLLEAVVRLAFPRVRAQDLDRRLVRPAAFGAVHGWVPGAQGIVFGETVRIDADGFRDHRPPAEADSILLLFGDSVTFGVGVPAESTFAGRLQHRFPHLRVVNTAAVGYTVRDYRALARSLSAGMGKAAAAVVVFSLNDFSTDRPLEVGAVPALAFLRRHSRLYLVLKNILFDRSRTYFLHDFAYYAGRSPEIAAALSDLRALVGEIAAYRIPVIVVLPPYEYQLRSRLPEHLLPQRVIRAALEGAPCTVVDLTAAFSAGEDPPALYLYGDHMHLSARGHARTADTLGAVLARSAVASSPLGAYTP